MTPEDRDAEGLTGYELRAGYLGSLDDVYVACFAEVLPETGVWDILE